MGAISASRSTGAAHGAAGPRRASKTAGAGRGASETAGAGRGARETAGAGRGAGRTTAQAMSAVSAVMSTSRAGEASGSRRATAICRCD